MDRLTAALDVLRAHGIDPDEEAPEFPDIGRITDDETVYATSLDAVFDDDGAGGAEGLLDRPGWSPLVNWEEQLRGILSDAGRDGRAIGDRRRHMEPPEPPEPDCAWYCPIHYYGHAWGIYIRERCILDEALRIALFVPWPQVAQLRLSFGEQARRLLRAAFYGMFLHEQFHHKVESLGFRLLLASASDKYRPYKTNVYRPTFRTHDCLEESLANADSFMRLDEVRYKEKLGTPFRNGLREYLRWSFPRQPPGYSDADRFLSRDRFANGGWELQSRVLDGMVPARTPTAHWLASPDVIRSMMDIKEEIYVILPSGMQPIFRPTTIDPGHTVSTNDFAKALTTYYGYELEKGGGKGSHIKLSKSGADPIILKGNQRTLTPGVVRQALRQLGGLPLSRLLDILAGRAP